jgi:hypothetical protein
MNDLAVLRTTTLPDLIDRASTALANARSSAEVLEAREVASFAYDVAKKTARLAKAKQAHDDLIAAAYRAQADALEIESQAKRRLADEYDAAQERGEVTGHGGDRVSKVPEQNLAPTVADLGLTKKDIHEARQIRDAEAKDPGIVRRVLDDKLAKGEEPTKAAVREEIARVNKPADPAPAPAADNVVTLGSRLEVVPSFEQVERQVEQESLALEEVDDFDPKNVEQCARAISGALTSFEIAPISGRDFWRIYGRDPGRKTYFALAKAAHATLTEIIDVYVKEYDDELPKAKGRRSPR